MTKLREYVLAHALRGACQCGQCADAPPNPEQHQPSGHTADMIFFKVSARKEADAETFKTLVRENQQGAFCGVNVLDGQEHDYFELGGWIGDQSLALMLMGLGTVLGVWKLTTPRTLMGPDAPPDLVQQMAGRGFVIVQAL